LFARGAKASFIFCTFFLESSCFAGSLRACEGTYSGEEQMKQHLIMELLEALPNFPMEQA